MSTGKVLINISKILGSGLVLYLLVLTAGFFLLKYNFTDTSGQIDEKNLDFQANEDLLSALIATSTSLARIDAGKLPSAEDSQSIVSLKKNFCELDVLSQFSPTNARSIVMMFKKYKREVLLDKMIFAASLKLEDNPVFQEKIKRCGQGYRSVDYDPDRFLNRLGTATSSNLFTWLDYEEWQNMREALGKDKSVIYQAASSTGIEPRLIVAVTMVEQLRMYYTQRALYKRLFAPLKILGNATKFSLGIMNVKEKTAIDIETHLKDKSSVFYLGPAYEHLLDFKATSTVDERYARLTDEKNHYYSYLYGALYIKQIMLQWKKAGFDISKRPEIIGTLFNIGFKNSHPKPKPEVGGAEIVIGGTKYSFGSLAFEFYYSGEMDSEFGYGQ